MTHYSHSRLSAFENCPKQYRYRYIERIEPDGEGIEAFVGKRVHEILERLYHHVQRHRQPPSLAQVQQRFGKDWLLRWHESIRIVRQENDVEFYRQLGERCLENYYRGHYPFDEGETLGIEKSLAFGLDEAGRYQIRGVIDRFTRKRTGGYEIHDYKTSGSLPPRRKLEQDRQLALYQIGIEQTYGDAEDVDLVWHYLAFNRTLRSRRTPEQLHSLRRQTIELIDQIEAAPEFPARPGPLCRWCDYHRICPEAEVPAGPPGPEPPPGELSPAPAARPAPAKPPRHPVQLSLLD